MTLHDAARSYLATGLCALPAIRAEKRPAVGQWKRYRKRLPTDAELSAWFANGPDAVCILCGGISGHAEMIDFDSHGELFDAWARLIPADLMARLVVETTQRGGRHVFYRCEAPVCGNMKLAQRRDGDKTVTLIETRGEGGLFLCAPTAGYEAIQGDLCTPPVLTETERDALLSAAWEMNEYLPPPVGETRPCVQRDARESPVGASGERPGDEFNRRGDMRAVLEKAGWALVKPGENEYWRRPGKASGWSASLKDRVFYVFSANASPFEPNRAYSPFSVYTLLHHGGDFERAAGDLRLYGYGAESPAGAGVDITALVASCSADDQPAGSSPTLAWPDPGPLPDTLLTAPGFIGEVMDYTMTNAPFPDLTLAFCGAVALQATLAGRKVCDSAGTRTSIYLLGLANSGVGKNYPREVNQRVLLAAGMPQRIAEGFASGEGIEDRMIGMRTMLFQTDEIDETIQNISKSRDGRAERIMEMLLKFFTSANSIYHARVKAGREPQFVDQPCLVLYGTAIPVHYYEALCDKMLTNGFFARMLVFEAGKRGEGRDASYPPLPPSVLEAAHWWANYRPNGGNLDEEHPDPAVVPTTDEARAFLAEARKSEATAYNAAQETDDAAAMAVWARAGEKARRLALIRALSQNRVQPVIDVDAVQWAWRIVEHQTRRMLFQAADHVSESDFDALFKRAVRYIREWRDRNGKDALMPRNELRRRLKQRPRDFEDVVTELTERGVAVMDQRPGKTKPRTGFRLL